MKRQAIKENFTFKAKDYSFLIAFFFIFSFFVFFAIGPNLLTLFTLNKELGDLNVLNKQYDDAISDVTNLQSLIEQHRDELQLLDQAVPPAPQVNKIIDDITLSASSSGLAIKKLNVQSVGLKEDKSDTKLKSFAVNLESEAQFPDLRIFLESLLSKRRLETIKDLEISQDVTRQSSSSANLKISMEVNGYYL